MTADNVSGQAGQAVRTDTPLLGGVRCPPCPPGVSALPEWMPPQAKSHSGCAWIDLAVGLVRLGYAPVPLGPEKVPLVKWGAFEVESPTWRVLYGDWWPAWQRATGVAMICGRPHGVVVVDFDDEPSWAWALGNLPAVRGVRTRRGGHLHFAHPARGIVGNRSGRAAIVLEAGVRADVKALGGLATGPCSRHPSGHVYEPLGEWTCHVRDLPVLPDVVARHALEKPPAPVVPPPPSRFRTDPLRSIEAYIRKAGGIPAQGGGSDEAVFRAASWSKANVPEVTEAEFVTAIRRWQPEFTDQWIAAKFRSARGR